eukprot:296116_1
MNEPFYSGLNPIDAERVYTHTEYQLSPKNNAECNFFNFSHNSVELKQEELQSSNDINMQSSNKFIQPQVSDYMECKDIKKCNGAQRIIHLLQYYEQNQKTSKFYEHFASLVEYDTATFMEDWR